MEWRREKALYGMLQRSVLCVSVLAATSCDVIVTVNAVSKTAGSQYTYDPAITPEITSVTPQRGGTAGGTLLTITGSGFGWVNNTRYSLISTAGNM